MNQSHVFATLFTGSMCLGATICHVIERKSLGLKIFDKENWIGESEKLDQIRNSFSDLIKEEKNGTY